MLNRLAEKIGVLDSLVESSRARKEFSQLDKDCAMEIVRNIYNDLLSSECFTSEEKPEIEVSLYGEIEDENIEVELELFVEDANVCPEDNEFTVMDIPETEESVILTEDDCVPEAEETVVYINNDTSFTELDLSEQEYEIVKAELCDCDEIECRALIKKLNNFDDFDEAILYIQDNYKEYKGSALEILAEKLSEKLM